MTLPVNAFSWSNVMRDGTEFNDQSSTIFELWNKYHRSKMDLEHIDELCQSFVQIKQNIRNDTTVEYLQEICKEHQTHQWVNEFTKNLSLYKKDCETNELDPFKANASLTACFDKAFWNSFGIQMLFYSIHSLFQSSRAWNLISNFNIPSYQNQIRRTREKLDQCISIANPILNLTLLNEEHCRKLERLQELLKDIKDVLVFLLDDIQNKIEQIKKYRSNSYLSSLINLFSTILNAILWDKVSKASGENSRSSLTTGASTLIQATATLGDLIHAGKANHLIEQLQNIFDIINDLEEKHQRLQIQVSNKLSIIHTII